MRPSASFAPRPAAPEVSELVADVRRGLTSTPKRLSPKWLYDAIGSSLFETICLLPCYTITRAEKRLLERVAPEIALRLPHVAELVELGPGSGEKLARLLAPFLRRTSPATATLIDISAEALASATARLSSLPRVEIRQLHLTFEAGLASLGPPPPGGRLVALLGSNIGNYDPDQADDLLRAVAGVLGPGDACLLGADLVKPERTLVEAYDDPIGVTAAFNRNLLARLNRELRAGFDLRHFAHEARWVSEARRIEMHLVSARPQTVAIPAAGIEARFERGESIWTESSHKYEVEQLEALGSRIGLEPAAHWIDEDARFALMLYTRS